MALSSRAGRAITRGRTWSIRPHGVDDYFVAFLEVLAPDLDQRAVIKTRLHRYGSQLPVAHHPKSRYAVRTASTASLAVAATGAAARTRTLATAGAAVRTGGAGICALGTRRTLITIPTMAMLLVVVNLPATGVDAGLVGTRAARGVVSRASPTGCANTSPRGAPRPRQPIIRFPRPTSPRTQPRTTSRTSTIRCVSGARTLASARKPTNTPTLTRTTSAVRTTRGVGTSPISRTRAPAATPLTLPSPP